MEMHDLAIFFNFFRTLFQDQTFVWVDVPILIVVIFVEILLSADNMLIIGILIKQLPKWQRSTAIWTGILGSVILRTIAILFASYLIRFYYFQGIGGLYLMYLAGYELTSHKSPITHPQKKTGLVKMILYILALDLVFSVDSILAAFAVVGISPLDGDSSPKLWIVVVGASCGIVLLRSFTSEVIVWLEKKPFLEKFTLLFVFWIGLRLLIDAGFSAMQIDFGINVLTMRELFKWIFWAITLLFFIYAGIEVFRNKKSSPEL